MRLISRRPNAFFVAWLLLVTVTGSLLPSPAAANDNEALKKLAAACVLSLGLVSPHRPAPAQTPKVPDANQTAPAAIAAQAKPATAPPAAKAAPTAEDAATTKTPPVNDGAKGIAAAPKAPDAKPLTADEVRRNLGAKGFTAEKLDEFQRTFDEEFEKGWADDNAKTPDADWTESASKAFYKSIWKWNDLRNELLLAGLSTAVVSRFVIKHIWDIRAQWKRREEKLPKLKEKLKPQDDELVAAAKLAENAFFGIEADDKAELLKVIDDNRDLSTETQRALRANVEDTEVVPVLPPDQALSLLKEKYEAWLSRLREIELEDFIADSGMKPKLPPAWNEVDEASIEAVIYALGFVQKQRDSIKDQLDTIEITANQKLRSGLKPGQLGWPREVYKLFADYNAKRPILAGAAYDEFKWAMKLGGMDRAKFKTTVTEARAVLRDLTGYLAQVSKPLRQHLLRLNVDRADSGAAFRNRFGGSLPRAAWQGWIVKPIRETKVDVVATWQLARGLHKATWSWTVRYGKRLVVPVVAVGVPGIMIGMHLASNLSFQHAQAVDLAQHAADAQARRSLLLRSALDTGHENLLKAVVDAWEKYDFPFWQTHYQDRCPFEFLEDPTQDNQSLRDISGYKLMVLIDQMRDHRTLQTKNDAEHKPTPPFAFRLDEPFYRALFAKIVDDQGIDLGPFREQILSDLASLARRNLYDQRRIMAIEIPAMPGADEPGAAPAVPAPATTPSPTPKKAP